MNICATTEKDIQVCECGVCGPLRRLRDASKARRKAVFKHRTGANKKGVGHWWISKLNLNLSGQDAAMPVGDR